MASDIARELRIAVEVHCKLYRYNSAGKKIALGSEIVRLVSQNPRDVVASLERALRERMGSAGSTFMLQYGFLHSFKVSLVYRGGRRGGTAFDPAWYRLGVWPQRMKHKPRLVLAADVQVLPCVYKELPMVLPALPGWPPGRYLLREHRVACGCVGCRQAQGYEVDGAYEEAGDEEGEEGEEGGAAAAMGPGASLEAPAGDAGSCRAPKRYRRRRRLDEQSGFWTPHRYVEHAAGVRLGGGRQPAGVPALCSQDWIRFRVPLPGPRQGPGPHGQPWHGTRHVELTVSELCRELGYSWPHRKYLPPPPPPAQRLPPQQ